MSMTDKQRREDIEDLVNQFLKKHPNAAGMGEDYIAQNDEAQTDALELVMDICDLFEPVPQLISYNEVPEEKRVCINCVHVNFENPGELCWECFDENKRINWYPKEE